MKQTFKMYDGLVELVYDEEATKNRYLVGGTPVRGVTGLLGDILHKQGLMLWPLSEAMKHLFGYRFDETTKLPSYNASKALLQPGTSYTADQLQTLLQGAYAAHRVKSDKSKDVGTLVHTAIEAFLADKPSVSLPPEAMKPFTSFMDWYLNNQVKVVWSERPIYSKTLEYAGRPDALVREGIPTVLVDFKTSEPSPSGIRVEGKYTGIYPEMFLQLGGYSYAYHEETGERPDELEIVNITKSGQLHTLKASQLGLSVTDCEQAFVLGLNLHNFLAMIKKIRPGSPIPELEIA